MSKRSIEYGGYISNYNKPYQIRQNNLFAYGNHIYTINNYLDAFDANGNKIGRYNKPKVINRTKYRKQNVYRSVVQLDFDFFVLPVGNVHDIPSVEFCQSVLKDVYPNYSFTINYKDSYSERYKTDKPTEVCCIGNSRFIEKVSRRALINFDYEKYLFNKNNSIEKWKDYRDYSSFKSEAESLFRANLKMVADFYCTTVEGLKRKSFNKNAMIIKRLHKNITNKTKTI